MTIKLSNLKRKNQINIPELRRGISNRFLLFSDSFQVLLNEKPITQDDIKFDDIEFTKDINEPVSTGHSDWVATGKIFGRKGTIRESENRGAALFARKKLVQEPTFFGPTSGKEYSYPHIFGRLTVDFVDSINDVVATNRSSINWKSEEGQALAIWGKQKMTNISVEFNAQHTQERKNAFSKFPETIALFEDLTNIERQKASKIVDTLASDDQLSEERAKDLISYVKNLVQYTSFQDLADKISEQKPEEAALIIDLFRQWEHLEAREMYHILTGRLSTIYKIRDFIKSEAKEVPTIHNYLRQFPWLLDPRWTIVYDEVKYSTLLKENFLEADLPESDRRIDFLSFASGPALIIVELKRPGKLVGLKDLRQLAEYSRFVRANLVGTDQSFSPENVYGYLICEKMVQTKEVDIEKKDMVQNRMYVRQYSELMSMALKIHNEFIAKFAKLKQITSEDEAGAQLAENVRN